MANERDLSSTSCDIILALAKSNLNISEVSRKLYLHRNTITYQVERIKEITGKDPLNFYDLYDLVRCVKARRGEDMSKEKRLIDATALDRKIVEMTREPAYQHTGEDWLCGLCMAMEAVNTAPIVDAVEVVRCKNCSYWDKAVVNKQGFLICPASRMEIMAHDYCSYGERKEGK